MKLAVIARSDKTGLGNQTRNIVRMLNPSKVILIDSTSFNGNTQHPEWYKDYNVTTVNGFIESHQIDKLLDDVDAVFSCETFYNNALPAYAAKRGIKTFLQYNYEFLDYLAHASLPTPDLLIAPSAWNFEQVNILFGAVHMPPPLFDNDFKVNRECNTKRSGRRRFLHVAGKPAAHDRNGTQALIDSLKWSSADFELVIKCQVKDQIRCFDKRVIIDTSNPDNETELYNDFDALILPRKYGGLCLPMNEALMSSLPVIMTSVSPNIYVLPADWLVQTVGSGSFQARTKIAINTPYLRDLGMAIDKFANMAQTELLEHKALAYKIANANFSADILEKKYREIIG